MKKRSEPTRDNQNSIDAGHDSATQNAYFRSALRNLSPNQGAELLWYARKKPGTLSLAQGEGDLPTPDFITDAAYQAMREGKTFYGPVLGHTELRQEISSYYARIYKHNIPVNRICVTGSGTTAMHLALTSILEEGDEVVAVTPVWKNLLGAVELAQSKIVQLPLQDTENGWQLDLDRLFGACNEKTKALLLVSPSNPTGWVMSRDEMKEVLDFARSRDIWIISDEVYARTVYEGVRAPSFLDISEPEDLLYTVNSFSKSWAMTGWRLGWLVGPAAAERHIKDIALYDNMGPCSFIQFGAIEALRHGEPFIKDQLSLWRKNRDTLFSYFKESGRIAAKPPQAGFYAFFKVEGEEDCVALATRLIDEAGLSLAPGCAFGECCKSYLRLCYAVSERRFEDAITRLDKIINP